MVVSPLLVGKVLAVTAAIVTPTGLFIDSKVKARSTHKSLEWYTKQYNDSNFLKNKNKCEKREGETITVGSITGTTEASAVCKGFRLIDGYGKHSTGDLHLEPKDSEAQKFVNGLTK